MKSKFIIVILSGGIGNQMFQYAFAKSLSINNNYLLYIDKNLLTKNSNRSFGLNKLQIDEKLAPSHLIMTNIYWKVLKFLKINHIFLNIFFDIDLFEQKPFDFSDFRDQIAKSNRSIILWGYWQNEMYFNDNKINICNILRSKNNFEWNFNTNLFYIALHIRRGDYLKNDTYNKIYNILDKEYYANAISEILYKVNVNIKVLIFFDEIDIDIVNMVKEKNIQFEIIDRKYGDEIFDLWLMSKCHFNILSNSTFSWWGAYLNNYSNKIVICPNNYFREDTLNNNLDLFPEKWIKI